MTQPLHPPLDRPARRREIVETARNIAAEQGWPAVTVRAMAARIGCSAPAIYQYFRDKDAVLEALAEDGRALLAANLDEAVAGQSGAGKKLRATIRALWAFSEVNRELYAVIFGLDGLAPHRGARDGLAPSGMIRLAAEFLDKRGNPETAGDLADRLMATAHGFICVAAADDFPGGRDKAFDLLMLTVEALLKGVVRHN
ncbi:TetR/AcrR family transcriptional regulator [Telmatospirillum siberiense]|uniref:HTH tetR-type domain-containing protein n=1 Tax=Telmatospirillum siberiense TaxID=382514 RepID=A0A2N3PPH8_9PROT|nr:TetR/AcrR family transcriptional regulator [Telmatospirillum siberiense]PKU22286.1 hypothetical protein CWS72_22210 [Telmatospirillum siberiense]